MNKKETTNQDTKPKRKMKKKYRNIILTVIIILCIGGVAFGVYKGITWTKDSSKIKKLEQDLLNSIIIEEVDPNTDSTELVNEPESMDDIYWQYKDVSMINVDVKSLKENENSDTVGWIQVPGTNINYPVVYSGDNEYYLNHDYLKRTNGGGWVFLDYENDLENLKQNNIIYGHRRYNESMFGTLKNVLSDSWLNNTDNHVIKVSTLNYNYLFQVFSIYVLPAPIDNYYIQTSWDTAGFQNFLDTIVGKSIYNFNTEVNTNSKVLTLSTCHNTSDRLVVHAKLIKVSQKS